MDTFLTGDTVSVTWVSSGVTADDIFTSLHDGSETLVSSATMSSSGNGHYYFDMTLPNTVGYYALRTEASVSGKPRKTRSMIELISGEVD